MSLRVRQDLRLIGPNPHQLTIYAPDDMDRTYRIALAEAPFRMGVALSHGA